MGVVSDDDPAVGRDPPRREAAEILEPAGHGPALGEAEHPDDGVAVRRDVQRVPAHELRR